MDPSARLKQLAEQAKLKAKVNHNVAPKMYLRSAIQLEQQVVNTLQLHPAVIYSHVT